MPSPSAPSLQRRLAPIIELLDRHALVEEVAHRQAHGRSALAESLLHRQQLAELATKLAQLRAADLAHLIEALPADKRLLVWEQLNHALAGSVLLETPDAVTEFLVENTRHERLHAILLELDIDDLASLSDLLPESVLQSAKQSLEASERRWLEDSIAYDESRVGAIMSHDMITVEQQLSVNQVIDQVRALVEFPQQADKLFVVNNRKQLVGVVPMIQLLRQPGSAAVASFMETDVLAFLATDEAEEAAQAFERYDLISAPVIDDRRHIIGRLTVETVMDTLRERAEDRELAKTGLSSDADLLGPVWDSARERWPWLAINLVTAFLATRFIGIFEEAIVQLVALATLMPVVASIGGNTGNQTVALMIRGLALDLVHRSNLRFVVFKETTISLVNGLLWGTVLGTFAWILYGSVMLGLVLMLSVTLNLMVAALIGTLVPVLLDRIGRDPAMGSSVMLTFATDSMGFFIFLGLAALILL